MPPKATPKLPHLGERRRTNHRGDSRADDEIELGSPAATRASARVRAAANMPTGLSPRPQRRSTNYGAPAFTASSHENPAYTIQDTDLQSGIARAVTRVQRDNREDQDARASRARSIIGTRPNLEETANSRNRLATAPPDDGHDMSRQSPQRTTGDGTRRPKRKSPEIEDPAERENTKRPRTESASPRSSPDATPKPVKTKPKTGATPRAKTGRPRGRPRLQPLPDISREASDDEPMGGPADDSEDDVDMVDENQPPEQAAGPAPTKQGDNTAANAPVQSAVGPTTTKQVSAPTQRDVQLYPDLSELGGPEMTAKPNHSTDMPPPSGGKLYWQDLPVTRTSGRRLNDDTNLLRNSNGRNAPQTPANGVGRILRSLGAAVQSSVAPTERSFNLESGLFQHAHLQTPPPQTSSVAPTPSAALESSLPPTSAIKEPPAPPKSNLPPGAPAWKDVQRQELPAARTQAYSWFADPPHRGVRSSSAEPGPSHYIATHIDHDLMNNAKLRQLGIDKGNSDDEITPRRRRNAARASPVKSGPVTRDRRERARTEDPEITAFPSRIPDDFVPRPARSAFTLPDPKLQPPIPEEVEPQGPTTIVSELDAAATAAAAAGTRNSRAQVFEKQGTIPAHKQHTAKHLDSERPLCDPHSPESQPHVGSSSSWAGNLEGLARCFQKCFDFKTLAKTFLYFALAIVTISWMFTLLSGPTRFEGHDLDTGFHWYGASDWKRNVGQFVSWSPFRRVVLSGDQYGDLKTAWESHDQVIARLKRQDEMTTAAISKLERALPKYVRIDRDKKGNAVIPLEFWRALKALARQDGDFVILDEKHAITDSHWKSFQSRLERAGDFETWVRENNRKLRDILGVGQGQETSGQDIDELVRKGIEAQNLPDKMVVMKQEFMNLIKDEYKNNMRGIKADVAALQRNHEELGKKLDRLSKSKPSAAGVTADEVRRITQKELRKAIGDMQLESLARGRMQDPMIADLKSRINYFGLRMGAIIDAKLSSPPYTFKYPRFKSPEWKRETPRLLNTPYSIVRAWDDDGECWCAGGTWDSKLSRPKPADILMRISPVIPQVLLMEHIHPLETADDKSMPKDVEVWIEVEEYGQRKTLRDWSQATFTNTDINDRLWDDNFVKVVEFVFKNETNAGPIEKAVKFPTQLMEFGVETESVLIRATSNYGARDHTCFYRVKLFGERPPSDDEARS